MNLRKYKGKKIGRGEYGVRSGILLEIRKQDATMTPQDVARRNVESRYTVVHKTSTHQSVDGHP